MNKNIKLSGKVRQLEHQNQFTIENEKGIYFQSYDSIIALKDKEGNIFLDKQYWDYSKTTVKHLCLFLDIVWSIKTVMQGIASGKYILTDLNE